MGENGRKLEVWLRARSVGQKLNVQFRQICPKTRSVFCTIHQNVSRTLYIQSRRGERDEKLPFAKMFPENDQIDLAAEEGHLMSLVVR